MTFTGSVTTGRAVAQGAAASLARVTLELGGNDAAILLDDVDVEKIADRLFWAAFRNCGQVCMAVKRVYAPARLCSQVAEVLAQLAQTAVVGAGLDPATQLGPVNNAAQLARVERCTARALADGARAVAGGHRLDRPGYFFAPTILADVPSGSPVVAEEQFGPVLPVLPYGSLDEAVAAGQRHRLRAGRLGMGDRPRPGRGGGRPAGVRDSVDQPPRRPVPRPTLRGHQGKRSRRRGRAVGALREPQAVRRAPTGGGVTMRFGAAVLRSYESRFGVEEVILNAGPADGEILVRIAGCGMCRTDLAVRRSAGRSPLPAVLGHEGAGVVVETGGPDTGLRVGDHVVLSFDSCGHCRNCMSAAPAYCVSFASLNLFGGRKENAARFTDVAGDELAPRWFGQSSFAEYAMVPARNAVRVDPRCPSNCSDRSDAASSPAPERSSTPSAPGPATPSRSSARERWAWPR